jgi:acetyl-CoA carboxylase biotin carboxylase subunit
MTKISRVLVANRGEIAVRIINACRSLGIETVLAISEADKDSLPAKMANRAVCIGPPRALDSYFKIDRLIAAALGTKSDAIHPGYGFLAEQPELAKACNQYGIIFIGPSSETIRQMGDKLLAKKMVQDCNIPVIPGSNMVRDSKEAVNVAEKIGFPVLLKASAGGGGRGMVIARNPNDLRMTFDTVSAEAYAAFGDGTLFLEHYIPNARHIEVQVIGDHFGNFVHLGERDCSIQRRYQKILEESPSPAVTEKVREKICKAALDISKHIGYSNAGTVEFILDQDNRRFYFLEMNTRIQVEHPVTEQITGVDIVQEQIKIAGQCPLSFSQKDIRMTGHAIECRINAEAPEAGFRVCPGRIEKWIRPQGKGIRVDSHCYSGYTVPPYYDSLLAKIITSGSNRFDAIQLMQYALKNFTVLGLDTTISFHQRLLENADFINGRVNTHWVEDVFLQ